MIDIPVFLGIIIIIISLFGSIPYIYNILKNKTKPHIFSWFLWALLGWIAFFAQISKGAGIGALGSLMLGIMCTITLVISLFKSKIDYLKKIDWFCLFAALFGITLWLITENPLNAIIVVSIVDAVAFFPSYRKAYSLPYQETLTAYYSTFLQSIVSLFALESLNLTTILYPASLILTNAIFILLVVIRRNVHK